MKKNLTRSKTNRSISGVLGGIGEYFDVDPILIRVAFVLVTAFTGFFPGMISYVLMTLIIPEKR